MWIGTPIAAIVLITVFVFLDFPYGQFALPLSQQLSQATGSEVSIRDIEPRLTIGGPGIAARDVRIITANQRRIDIDPLKVRPAWSTSWLSGNPTLKIELESLAGSADGYVTLGDVPAWSGEFAEVDLARIPVDMPAGMSVSGVLTAAADLVLGADGATGPLSFDIGPGQITHPNLPVPVDFERVNGDLMLGDEVLVDVRSFELDGPTIFFTTSGQILPGRRPGDPQLALKVELRIKSAPLQLLLRQGGLELDADGGTSFELRGTPSAPRPR